MTIFPDDERRARIRLARTHGVGAVGFGQLLDQYGSGRSACASLEEDGRKLIHEQAVDAELDAVARLGATHLLLGEAAYPPLLAVLADPPPVLIALGDPGLAARPVVAIVGARNASSAGQKLARHMALELGAAGWVVISGLARGIDLAAHQGSLSTGTIACIAGGVDIAYPPEHARLQADIAASGLLLSEFPPGVEPMARHFPRRNRLIAGIASGLVVIEAANGSGSMITARLAGEMGREVMAVPGHPTDPRARGGNRLIRDGATLVEQADDVRAVLAPFTVEAEAPEAPRRRRAPVLQPRPVGQPLVQDEDAFLSLLSAEGVALDELVRISGLPVAEVQARLSDLEIEGKVARLVGGKVTRLA